ncbi:hypothetical protein DL93DRAFT_2087451 [Clavulina sp. PMI_390]|nr:hypothetical protein DL93DRAFT_2087451 [Clavulina sp. PMI_390]
MDYNLPIVKRVITGHNARAQSTPIIFDDIVMESFIPGSDTKLGRVWTTKETPANNDDQKTDLKEFVPERLGLVQPNGSQICILDTPPGWRSSIHRTSSIDYIILVSGAITLLLDTDDHSSSPDVGTTISVPGSIIVQRGTRHMWENRSKAE